jgi:hypothetical protein
MEPIISRLFRLRVTPMIFLCTFACHTGNAIGLDTTYTAMFSVGGIRKDVSAWVRAHPLERLAKYTQQCLRVDFVCIISQSPPPLEPFLPILSPSLWHSWPSSSNGQQNLLFMTCRHFSPAVSRHRVVLRPYPGSFYADIQLPRPLSRQKSERGKRK